MGSPAFILRCPNQAAQALVHINLTGRSLHSPVDLLRSSTESVGVKEALKGVARLKRALAQQKNSHPVYDNDGGVK